MADKNVNEVITTSDAQTSSEIDDAPQLHFAARGGSATDLSTPATSISGYDPEIMSGRALLSAEEEKKLLRKIDWRLMTLCSLIFMFKNLDSQNVCLATSCYSYILIYD